MEGARRRLTLSDQMSVLNASNLRDLLRVRDDDNGRESLSGLTLGAVLSCPKRSTPVQVSRTLMEIIRDEETGASYRGLVDQNNKKSWKSFKDRLRLRRASAVCSSSSTTHPGSGIDECRIQISPPFPNNPPTGNSNIAGASTPSGIQPASSSETQYNTDSSSTGVNEPVITRLSAALEAEREQQRPEEGLSSSVAAVEEVAPVRMSLMALLEETDRQAGMAQHLYPVGIRFAGYVPESFGLVGVIALSATASSWKFSISSEFLS
ncbi:hypothetical protein HHK36_027089 [Tetracentron sinense]|uniref:Uncharacterized protein n=1 Tax=Tetracentron sinense TaxID=13715 RepID=A0A834Y3N3_TETSI|nr:hypothetical protein HHK36_033285 [Tetracentron sinense]KAF8388420.1 hypothetical protein HHK36_027089 [Tetracentron sinense]